MSVDELRHELERLGQNTKGHSKLQLQNSSEKVVLVLKNKRRNGD